MGYEASAFSLGHIDSSRDPIAAVRPELEKIRATQEELGAASKSRDTQRQSIIHIKLNVLVELTNTELPSQALVF